MISTFLDWIDMEKKGKAGKDPKSRSQRKKAIKEARRASTKNKSRRQHGR